MGTVLPDARMLGSLARPADRAGQGRRSVGAAETTVHVDPLAGDVARLGRAEERHQVRHVTGVAEVPQWDLAGELLLALFRGMQAPVDLLAVDASGGEAGYGDGVTAHVARDPLRPRGHRRPGRARP